jgi:hypothetical protein
VREVLVRVRIGEDGDIKEPDYGIHIRVSGEYEIVHDRYLPTWLELTIEGHDGPNLFRRIEVRDGRPELVAMSWWSIPGQREIKQKDLRNLPVASILDEVYPAFVIHVDHVNEQALVAAGDSPAFYAAQRFVENIRGPGHRAITDELLKKVAEVYRRNIDRAPTQAVARSFGVKSRMASTYVDRARRAGYLPPTRQGQKKA